MRPDEMPEPAGAGPASSAERRTGKSMSEMLAERQVSSLTLDLRAMAAVSNVYRVAMRARNHFEQGILRDSGLTWTGFVTLWVLWVWGEMQTRWLAEEVGVNRSTLSGVLNTLERRGLIRRRGHETEGRLVLAELTPAGETLIGGLFPRFNAEESFIVSRLSPRQQDELADLLRTIHSLLDAEGEDRREAVRAAGTARPAGRGKPAPRLLFGHERSVGGPVPDVRGFFAPRTATGKASLLPPPPWFYSGDLLTIEYRVDPARVRELLPDPLEPAGEDPGAVAFIWADWQSCGADGAQLLDPVLGQYKEAFVVVRCRYAGQIFSRCVYIWVDTDFALARGLHQGYPKKLGAIHMTRPHPYGPAPRIEPGARFGASLAAADRRLAEARITLIEPAASNGFVNAHAMAHSRTVASIEDPAAFSLDELIATASAGFEGGPPWRAQVDAFALHESPTEELDRLRPRELIGAYYRQVGVQWNGGRLLRDNLAARADAGQHA